MSLLANLTSELLANNITLSEIYNFTRMASGGDGGGRGSASGGIATELSFCGEGMASFRQSYRQVHGYLSIIVCVFGVIANSLNIVVLTRRDMISPTNAILTGLAFADILVMIEYIPFTVHMYLLQKRSLRDMYTYGWAVFVLIHSHVTQVFHTISIWLTVTLAVWRYLAVAYPSNNRNWCSLERAIAAILSGYVCSPVLCIPSYLMFSIKERLQLNKVTGAEEVIYLVVTSDLAKANNRLLENISFWTYGVVIKIIPCVILTILSIQLIKALMEAKKRKKKLKNRNKKKTTSANGNGDEGRQTDRTTRMLLAVLFLFLITEFPQGILGLLSCILGNDFFVNCYSNLGEIMDILALINSAINFILYCSMSRQFRLTFSRLFKPRMLDSWNAENESSNAPQLRHHLRQAHTKITAINDVECTSMIPNDADH